MTLIRRLILAAALMAGLSPVMAQVPPPVPGLPDTERRTSYSLSGTTCACSVGFQLYGDSTDFGNWVEVFINGAQVQSTDPVFGWTITSPTGPLATIPRPITDAVLTFNSAQTGTVQIVGARRPRRVSQFSESTGVSARNLNQALTDIVAQNREVWDKINDVTGRVPRAPPGESMTTLPPAASRANQGVCFDSGGNMVPCIGLPSTSSFSAGNGITFTGTNPTVISDNAQGSAPIVVTPGHPTTIACPTCNTSQNSTFIPISSRAAALSLNLSAYSAIRTGGYAAPGDGGGATFKNVGAAPFIDSFISGNLTIATAGTGCTNGSFANIYYGGGTGIGAVGTITVAGGSVTNAAVSTPGNRYTAGDPLTDNAQITCSGTHPTFTVAAVTTPSASFTDTAGNHWQYIIDSGNYINVRQFGAKVNWNRTAGDAGSTDDTVAVQSALNYAYFGNAAFLGAGGVAGQPVLIPSGYALTCALVVPLGVTLKSVGPWSGGLKECDSLGSSLNYITVCDSTTGTSCFGSQITDMSIFPGSGAAAAGEYMIVSNNIQQSTFLSRVTVAGGNRGAINLEAGFGGAAMIGMSQIEAGSSQTNTPVIRLNYSTAVATLDNVVVEDGGTFCASACVGVLIVSGYVKVTGFHTEGINIGINIFTTSQGISTFHNITCGAGNTDCVRRDSTATSGLNVIGAALGSTHTLNNAGAITSGNIVGDVVF